MLIPSGMNAEIARKLDRNGRRGVAATVAATSYRGMNALHAAVGGLGKLAVCRYLVDEVGMDVNMWDTSPSTVKSTLFFFPSSTARYLAS